MEPVELDESLVARFKDKTMAIVGYEANVVRNTYSPIKIMRTRSTSLILAGFG